VGNLYSCRAKDFGHEQDETVQNSSVKTESLSLKKIFVLAAKIY
jgi:hypothetical protein